MIFIVVIISKMGKQTKLTKINKNSFIRLMWKWFFVSFTSLYSVESWNRENGRRGILDEPGKMLPILEHGHEVFYVERLLHFDIIESINILT